MTITVGSFVVDATAKHADDAGAVEEVGVRGIVTHVVPDWLDERTGEVDDLLTVATRHHGRIGFVTMPLATVAESWPCGRVDAGGYIAVCQREITRAGRRSIDNRVVEVLALATRIKESPTAPAEHVPSIFPTPEEDAAYDAGDLARADELRRAAMAGHPVGQAHDLLDRMNASTQAHQERNRAS